MIFAAAGGITDPVTLGLGVIAVALFFGEFAFFKWIYGPALKRADAYLTTVEARHKEEMIVERERYSKLELKTDKYFTVLEDKALPALSLATTTVSQVQSFITEMQLYQERQTRKREIEAGIQRGTKPT